MLFVEGTKLSKPREGLLMVLGIETDQYRRTYMESGYAVIDATMN